MPYKNPDDSKKYMRKWRKENPNYDKQYYQKNKEIVDQRNTNRINKLRQTISEYKKEQGCKYCEENEPVALDFHHKNPKEKEYNIAEMVSNGFSIEKIMVEINKCYVVCCNCHRKIENGLIV